MHIVTTMHIETPIMHGLSIEHYAYRNSQYVLSLYIVLLLSAYIAPMVLFLQAPIGNGAPTFARAESTPGGLGGRARGGHAPSRSGASASAIDDVAIAHKPL